MSNKKEKYYKKLLDKRWTEFKKNVLIRDKFKCKKCSASNTMLHVHHKIYINGLEPWEYDLKYLITLCEKCHQHIHDTQKIKFKNLKKKKKSKLNLKNAWILKDGKHVFINKVVTIKNQIIMKKAIFTLLVALATTMSYAQVKVSTTSTTNLYSTQMSQIRMVKITIDSSSQYVLYYKNLKYTTITDIDYITFNDPQEALDFLSLLNGVAETGNNVIVTIGNQNLSIQKGMGERATVFHDGGFFYLSKKQSLEMIAILEKENQ